ncbi:tight junction protein ZO-1 [Elysia marginata]|uniref:Tight junction protein ZO-1 n=1 Tax=Elysia marginata TaxID=1093978 RepID=A0AAV4FBQ1_9GAST|nr:tight junction protein ZO-1 [Elysia marginata]
MEPRQVSFPKDKQTGLGLRLAGGNATGIFIASVQPGSAGEREGLVEGDNILMANEREISGLTREEAVSYLTSLTGQVSMLVQYRKEGKWAVTRW